MSRRVLEICCDSLESARAALAGGADRIELCVDLPADGLTPTTQLLADVAELGLPVFVLVRCRGGDFVFSGSEVGLMCEQIAEMRACGADGIVCGALTAEGRVDVAAVQQFVSAADGLPFTFHKGFDACADLARAMEDLVGLGIERVLTSGGQRLAVEAVGVLAQLANIGGETTRILCGGGVRSTNLADLLAVPGLGEFHSAARQSVERPVDSAEVRRLRAVLDGV